MARLVFLGTAAALPLLDRANTCLAVSADDAAGALLIDCGGDPYRALLRAGIGPDAVSDLFISHAHIDHIGGLPSLVESFRLGGRTKPLRVLALPVVQEVARRLVDAYPFELKLDQWTYDVRFEPVEDGQILTLAGMEARVATMDHSIPTLGLRLELPGGALAYTCDTQPNPNIRALARGARTLVTECTFLSGYEAAARASKHLTASEAGQAAAECGAERLALVHLGTEQVVARAAAEASDSFSGGVIVPADGDALEM